MLTCRKCKSDKIHRSRTRTKWESWRKEITGKRPYRCPVCGWRGWGVDRGPKFGADEIEVAARALAQEPPNLTGAELARTEAASRDLDLDQLDTVKSVDSNWK